MAWLWLWLKPCGARVVGRDVIGQAAAPLLLPQQRGGCLFIGATRTST